MFVDDALSDKWQGAPEWAMSFLLVSHALLVALLSVGLERVSTEQSDKLQMVII